MTAGSNHETSLAESMASLETPDVPSIDLAADGDVKLWLQHTGFFDVEHRQKVLGALKQLKALDEQRQKIISGIHSASPYVVPPPPSTPAFSRATYSPSLCSAQKASPLVLDRLGDYANLSGYRATRTQSAGELCGSEPSLVNKGCDSESAYSAFGNASLSSQQCDGPAPDSSVKHAELGSQEEEQSASKGSSVVEAGDGIAWAEDEVAQPSTPTQEARYFLVKSFNTMNVEMSQRDGLWITKADNGPMLSFAFNQCKTVYLLFSINKSKGFQGYARMTTAPDPTIAPAKWMSNISWKTSHPFRIEWLNTRRTPFWTLGDLKNAFNDDALVFVGRDGQEYPEDCGRKILEVLDQSPEEISVGSPWASPGSPRSSAKSGKGQAPNWRRMESSSWGRDDAVPAQSGSGPADDVPLIEY
ncbi:YT521-B-like domain-containing protein [Trichoderma austrokoningii]